MTNEKQAVLDTVKDFLDSYAQRSIERCMSLLSVSRPILLFGTNENEVFKTHDDLRSAFKRDFESMTHIRWGKHRQFHVEALSTLASVLVELPISYQSEGKEVETLFRYALTLTKEGEQWKICSGMASVPFMAGTYSFSE
jgi:ketosteroid isomerase-like protein